jgi:hypothetical protein
MSGGWDGFNQEIMKVTMKKLAIIQDEQRPASSASSAGGPPQRRTIPVRHISLRNCAPALAQRQPESHPLDAILDELNANVRNGNHNHQQMQQHQQQPMGTNEISASFTLRLAAAHPKMTD